MTKIAVIDTETTGLLKPIPTESKYQPFITEIYICKLDENHNFLGEFESMVKPPIPISQEITRITGITDADLVNAPTFFDIYEELYSFVSGTDIIVGQNIEFDIGVLYYELMRHNLDKKFCYPQRHICTVESSFHYFNKRLNLQKLHKHLFGEGFEDAHRAKSDVMATTRCFLEMIKRGDIVL